MEPIVLKPRAPNVNRRSRRVLLSIGIIVSGSRRDGHRFLEETVTANVNAHGAMILLNEGLESGQLLDIHNVKTGEDRSCIVIDIGAEEEGQTEVGIEFLEPSPRFWGVAFPPDDWSPRSPEAKQYSGPPAIFPKKTSSK